MLVGDAIGDVGSWFMGKVQGWDNHKFSEAATEGSSSCTGNNPKGFSAGSETDAHSGICKTIESDESQQFSAYIMTVSVVGSFQYA